MFIYRVYIIKFNDVISSPVATSCDKNFIQRPKQHLIVADARHRWVLSELAEARYFNSGLNQMTLSLTKTKVLKYVNRKRKPKTTRIK